MGNKIKFVVEITTESFKDGKDFLKDAKQKYCASKVRVVFWERVE